MLDGTDNILRNARGLIDQWNAAVPAAADEVALKLESTAKNIGPWTDRTGNLRNSIKGRSFPVGDGYRMVVSESMSYAPFVEAGTSRSKPYPSLWPAVVQNQNDAISIFARHLKL